MEQNRFRSYVLWVAVAALIGTFLNDLGVVNVEIFDGYVNQILYVLVLLGIINSPTNKGKL